MHSYYSNCAFMYNFTPTDVGVFFIKMYKMKGFTSTYVDTLISPHKVELKSSRVDYIIFFFFFYHLLTHKKTDGLIIN